jgi:hypothetical protein
MRRPHDTSPQPRGDAAHVYHRGFPAAARGRCAGREDVPKDEWAESEEVAGEDDTAAAAAGTGDGLTGAVGAALVAAVGRGGEGEAEAEGADGGEVSGTEEEAPAAGRGAGAVGAVGGPLAAAAVGRGCTGHRMSLWGPSYGGWRRPDPEARRSAAAVGAGVLGGGRRGGATGREVLKLGTRYGGGGGSTSRQQFRCSLVIWGKRPH